MEALKNEAYQFMKKEIFRICQEENIPYCASLYSICIKDSDGDEIEHPELEKLILWFDEFSGWHALEFVYDNGEWHDGSDE